MAQIAEGSCEAVGLDGPQAAQEKRKQIYARSKTIDEPVFGQTKKGRGLRRFLLRGLEKVNEEWLLWGTTHNLNKVWRYLKQQDQQQAMAMGEGSQPHQAPWRELRSSPEPKNLIK